jgi:uncharacterized protein YrrD
MLNKAKILKGYKLNCLDGIIGKVREFYFDDQHWTIRYLVADTGNWLTGRQVLISPYALVAVNTIEEQVAINLTKKQIEDSPSLDNDKPISRQFEEDYYGHFGWPWYWDGPNSWGQTPYLVHDRQKWQEFVHGQKKWDPNLRSTDSVMNHRIQATDGEIGHVDDFIIDDETWAIRYLVVDTRNWWPGKKVLISPRWIKRVSWNESKVFVSLSREKIKQSPEYSELTLPTREYETQLHRHYDHQAYWVAEPADMTHVH